MRKILAAVFGFLYAINAFLFSPFQEPVIIKDKQKMTMFLLKISNCAKYANIHTKSFISLIRQIHFTYWLSQQAD